MTEGDILAMMLLITSMVVFAAAKARLDLFRAEKKKHLSQIKSREVLLGHALEKLAPYIDGLGIDPQTAQFLGQPIDFISFGEDEITFIEVKGGKSQLSKKQRKIRELVKEKKVNWKEVRLPKSH
jgi:predicted Holliday junction resolvase-like endonuclease